jgi:hypothetical protein
MYLLTGNGPEAQASKAHNRRDLQRTHPQHFLLRPREALRSHSRARSNCDPINEVAVVHAVVQRLRAIIRQGENCKRRCRVRQEVGVVAVE